MTIGSVTRTIDAPKYDGFAFVAGGIEAAEEAYDYANDSSGYHENYAYSYLEYATPIPTSLDTSFTATSIDGYGYQELQLLSYDATGTATHLAYAEAYGTTLTVTNGVPEPATWALMIGGFGAVGTAARRRRAVVLA